MWYVPVRDIILDDLIRLSPVPVEFVSNIGKSDVKNATRLGVYWYGSNSSKSKIKSHIEILSSLKNHQKIACLLHEMSHAKCDKENCKCAHSSGLAEGEIHAYEYTLKWLLENKQKKILKSEMGLIKHNCNRIDYYGDATKHVMKTELWQKCLDFVK